MSNIKQNEQRISELEDIAEIILEHKNNLRPRKPIVIEFCGTPKAGKTTSLSSLNIFLKRNGFKTRIISETATICPISNKLDPVFNIWNLFDILKNTINNCIENDRKIDVLILDRGIFDSLIWFEFFKNRNLMNQKEYDLFKKLITYGRFNKFLDLVISFKITPEDSIYREFKNMLTKTPGRIMNKKALKSYNESLDICIEKYEKNFRKLIPYNISKEDDQAELNYEVTKNVLESLKDMLVEKVGYFDRTDLSKFEESNDIFELNDLQKDIKLKFGFRTEIEDDIEKVQLLPIVFLTSMDCERILVVKKNPKSLGENSPEKNKILLYFGGHLRFEDKFNEYETTIEIIKNTLQREIQEELSIPINISDKNPRIIWLKNEGEKTEKHMAIVFHYKTDLEDLHYKLDEYEFIQTKGKSVSGRIVDCENLKRDDLESWSIKIYEDILNKEWHNQLELNL